MGKYSLLAWLSQSEIEPEKTATLCSHLWKTRNAQIDFYNTIYLIYGGTSENQKIYLKNGNKYNRNNSIAR